MHTLTILFIVADPPKKKITLKANTKKKISTVMARVSKRRAAQAEAQGTVTKHSEYKILHKECYCFVACDLP